MSGWYSQQMAAMSAWREALQRRSSVQTHYSILALLILTWGTEDDYVFKQGRSSCPFRSCLFQYHITFQVRALNFCHLVIQTSRSLSTTQAHHQVNYENNGGMYMYQCAKAVVMMMQCLNVKVTQGGETRRLEGKLLDTKSPQHGA